MRFCYQHVPGFDTQALYDKLAKNGFEGAVHRVDYREDTPSCIMVDVRDDQRNDAMYDNVRSVCKAAGLVPDPKMPECDVVCCTRYEK